MRYKKSSNQVIIQKNEITALQDKLNSMQSQFVRLQSENSKNICELDLLAQELQAKIDQIQALQQIQADLQLDFNKLKSKSEENKEYLDHYRQQYLIDDSGHIKSTYSFNIWANTDSIAQLKTAIISCDFAKFQNIMSRNVIFMKSELGYSIFLNWILNNFKNPKDKLGSGTVGSVTWLSKLPTLFNRLIQELSIPEDDKIFLQEFHESCDFDHMDMTYYNYFCYMDYFCQRARVGRRNQNALLD
jgi:hypothetical protein